MKIINKILITVTMALLINTQSIYAAKNTLLVSANYMPKIIQKINYYNEGESPTLPQFEINDFEYNFHLINKDSYVSFILSSPEFVSYYIYLINNENTIFYETSGFINHNSKKIDLNLHEMIAGNYDLWWKFIIMRKYQLKKPFHSYLNKRKGHHPMPLLLYSKQIGLSQLLTRITEHAHPRAIFAPLFWMP